MNRAEQAFQQQVVAYLDVALGDALFFHVPNSSGNRGARLGGILKSMGLKAGVADLVIINEFGRAFMLELKAGKGSQSSGQKAFAADCERLHIPYAVCRTLPEVEGTLTAWGFTPRARIAA
jgi:hypothetical protein